MKYVLLSLGVIVIIPLDLLVAFGMSFTAPSNLKMSHVVFLLFACLLDIPAITISFIRPRLGSSMILLGTAVSLAMAAAFFMGHGEWPTRKVGGQALVFWGLKLVVGVG